MDATINAKQYNELKSLLLQLDEKLSYLMAEKQKELLTPKEVQQILGIGESTYKRYIKTKIIPQIKIRGKVYVRREELEKLIKEGRV